MSSSTSASPCSSRASPARASCTSSPTATSGTTSTSAPTRARSTGRSTTPTCLSPTYDGAWDARPSVCHPKEADCFAWAKFWAGGLTYYGGFIGASLGAVYLLRRDRFPFWKAADMAGFAVPLGLALRAHGLPARGLLLRPETSCRGGCRSPRAAPRARPSEGPRARSMNLPSHPLHPTQIYESAACLAIAAVCLWVSPAQALRRPGLRRLPRALRGGALPPRVLPRRRSRRPVRGVDLAVDRRPLARGAVAGHVVLRKRADDGRAAPLKESTA